MGFFKTLFLVSSALVDGLKEIKKEYKIEQEKYNEDLKKSIYDIKIGGIEYVKIDLPDNNKPYYNIVKREIGKLSDPADIYRGSYSFEAGNGSRVTYSGDFTTQSWAQESIRAARRKHEYLMELTDIIYTQMGKRDTIKNAVEELQICIRFCNLRSRSVKEKQEKLFYYENASSLRSYLCLLLKEVNVYQRYEKECLFYSDVKLFKESKEGYMINFLFEGFSNYQINKDLTHQEQIMLIEKFTDITQESKFSSERYDLQKLFNYLFQERDFKVDFYGSFVENLLYFQFDDFDLFKLMQFYQLLTINVSNELKQANIKYYNNLIADYKTLKYMSSKDIHLYFKYKARKRHSCMDIDDIYETNQIDLFSRRFNLLRDELYPE